MYAYIECSRTVTISQLWQSKEQVPLFYNTNNTESKAPKDFGKEGKKQTQDYSHLIKPLFKITWQKSVQSHIHQK